MMRVAPLLLLGVALLSRTSAGDGWPPVYSIPRVERVKIDGDATDWRDRGFRIEVLAPLDGRIVPMTNFDSLVRVGWTRGALLVTVAVVDDAAVESGDDDELTDGDSVEILVTLAGRESARLVVAPGADPKHPKMRTLVNAPLAGAAGGFPEVKLFKAASRKTAAGYVVEAMIPIKRIGDAPADDLGIGLQVIVNDVDRPGGHVARHMWYPADDTRVDWGHTYQVRLREEASPPVTLAVAGRYEHARSHVVVLANSGEYLGKRVEFSDGPCLKEQDVAKEFRPPLAMGVIERVGDRYGVTLATAAPPLGKPYGPLNVYVDSQQVVQLLPVDQEASRMSELSQLEVAFRPCVFDGAEFPRCDFAEAAKALELIGETYVLTPTFYNAAHEKVEWPDTPGRYGAVVDIATAGGKPLGRRLVTLFRRSGAAGLTEEDLHVELAPGGRVGLDAQVIKEQHAVVGDFLKEQLVDHFANEPDAALLMAALAETKAGDPPLAGRNSIWARDQKWWFGLKQKLKIEKYKFLIDVPASYDAITSWDQYSKGEHRYPTLLFLHGSGERGDDLALVRAHGPPKLMHDKAAFAAAFPGHGKSRMNDVSDFLVISPQCPAGEWWSAPQLNALVDELVLKHRVDPDRIYVTGLSMGGYGAWELAAEYPERFAAIAPVCGAGSPADAERLKNLPAWVFHGEKDRSVPFRRGVEMVEALKRVGAPVKFTAYPEAGHDSWTKTYANPELYEWLLKQKRGAAGK